MESTDDVQLRGTSFGSLHRIFADLVYRHLVGAVLVLLAMKCAERTRQGANVGIVDVPVDVVVGSRAMHTPPHEIRHSADSMDIVGVVEHLAVFKEEPPAFQHLRQDWFQGSITKSDRFGRVGCGLVGHDHFRMVRGSHSPDGRFIEFSDVQE